MHCQTKEANLVLATFILAIFDLHTMLTIFPDSPWFSFYSSFNNRRRHMQLYRNPEVDPDP